MSNLGTVHVVIDGTDHPYLGVPADDDGTTIAIRADLDGPTTVLTGYDDWWWRVDPDQLPEWARSAAEQFADKVRRP